MNEHKVPAAPESLRVLARITCPACGKEAAMRYNYTLYGHGPNLACSGGGGDAVLTKLLGEAGLEARHEEPDDGVPWEPHPGNRTRYQEARAVASPRAQRVLVAMHLAPAGANDSWETLAAVTGIPIAVLRAAHAELFTLGFLRRKK